MKTPRRLILKTDGIKEKKKRKKRKEGEKEKRDRVNESL